MSTVAYPACRSFGHVWKPLDVELVQAQRVYLVRLECVQCRTIRTRVLTHDGYPVTNRYEYALGYQVKGGITPETKAGLRRMTALGLPARVHPEEDR